MTSLIIAMIFLMVLVGVPLFAVILFASLIGFNHIDVDSSVIAIELYRLSENTLLIALPFFCFCGYLLSESNAGARFMSLIRAAVGRSNSGLGIVSLLLCIVFTALTGASGVTIVALGGVLLPALLQANYDRELSLGLVTAAGSLGLLLPPSIPLILYGVVAQQVEVEPAFTMQQLFIAGILPTVLMVALFSAYLFIKTRHLKIVTEAFSFRRLGAAFKDVIWEFPMPIVIFLGIYSGLFALSEIAAVTAFYLLVVEVVIRREISLKQLAKVIHDSLLASSCILIILAASFALSNYLVDIELPMYLMTVIQERVSSPWVFLLFLNILLILLGAVFDIYAALFIVAPLLLPIAIAYDIHPIHFGIIFLTNLQIGYLTPPIGMNLFISSIRFDEPLITVIRSVLPYIIILLVTLVLITYLPFLSMVLIDGTL